MSIRTTASDPVVALYDSVSGWAFGPTFDTAEEADDFLEWAGEYTSEDLRKLSPRELELVWTKWQEEGKDNDDDSDDDDSGED